MVEMENQKICGMSRNRSTWMRIELLSSLNNVVDYLEGDITGGSIQMQNGKDNNLQRRSGSVDLILRKDLAEDYYKVDMKYRVRVIFIIRDNITEIESEYNLGIYILNSPKKSVNRNSITVTLSDLMCQYNGELGGSLVRDTVIQAGSPFRKLLIDIATSKDLMNLDMSMVNIQENDFELPYDIEKGGENNIADLLKDLEEMFMDYDLYFNEDGVLVYEKMSNHIQDQIIQEYDNSDVIINYDVDEDFKGFYNCIHIIGMTVEESDDVDEPYVIEGWAKLETGESPLCVENFGREVWKTIADDKVQTLEQADSRALYELDMACHYNEKITLTMLPDPRLVPNRVIKVNYEDDNISINGKYLIDSISLELRSTGTMTVSAHKIYM